MLLFAFDPSTNENKAKVFVGVFVFCLRMQRNWTKQKEVGKKEKTKKEKKKENIICYYVNLSCSWEKTLLDIGLSTLHDSKKKIHQTLEN